MNLLVKILIWMFPVALPVMGFTWNYYQVQLKASAEQMGHISSLVSSSGARELNDYLRLRASEFSIIRKGIDSCDDNRRGGSYQLLVRDLLEEIQGFSALVVSDTEGRVIHSQAVASHSNRYMLPRVLDNVLLLPAQEFDSIRNKLALWQSKMPAFRVEKNRLFLEALTLEKRGETNSELYRKLQSHIFNLNQLLQTPPSHISYAGGLQAEALGLPYRQDTFLFTQPLLNCEQDIEGYITAFLDRTQLEDRLFFLRQSLQDRGINEVDVVLVGGENRTFETASRFLSSEQLRRLKQLPVNSAEYVPVLGGFISVANVADEKVMGRLLQQEEISAKGISDLEYKQMINNESQLKLVVYLSETEWKEKGQALLYEVSKWLIGSMLFLFVLVLFLARNIVAPIVLLKQSVQKVADGDLSASAQVSSDDEVGQLASAFNKMTESLARSEMELKQLATTDALTGLINRRALTDEAIKERHRANRGGTDIVIAMLDIDHFKRINDRYGHSVGDIVLQRFSEILQSQLRVTDLVSRVGGEEFVVLLPNTDLETGHWLMAKILNYLEATTIELEDGASLQMSFSAGVTLWSKSDGFDRALSDADNKMYQAKEQGRHCIVS